MLLGLDDLINTITNDDMTKDLMDSMSGGNADLGNMLDLMAKNGNDEDYEKELEDLEFLLSF